MQAAISERFLDELAAVGDEAEVRDGIDRYRDGGSDLPLRGPDARNRLRGDAASGHRVGIPARTLPIA